MYEDRAPLALQRATKDPVTGFLRGTARVTRTGTFLYKGVPTYRDAKDVFDPESMKTLSLVPITRLHHGAITEDNVKALQIGSVGEPVRDGDYLVCPYVITDSATIQDILDKKITQLSCGFHCQTARMPGMSKQGPYEMIQFGMRYNHVALVEEGRAGPEVSLVVDTAEDQEIPMTLIKFMLGTVPLFFENDADLKSFQNAQDAQTARIDALQKQAAQLTQDASDEAFFKRADARGKLIQRANVLDSATDFSKMPDRDIRLKALETHTKQSHKDKSDAYIEAAFDMHADAAIAKKGTTSVTQDTADTVVVKEPFQSKSFKDAHAEMIARNRTQHVAK